MFCVSDVNQKHEEKYNRTSSDLMDKINQIRHGASEEVLLYFSSCFWFTSETQNRMEINL